MSDDNDFGINCANCHAYAVWNDDHTEIIVPCVSCARQGDPTKHEDSFHNHWNWRWNGRECWGSQANKELTDKNEVFEIAFMCQRQYNISFNECMSRFIPTSLVNDFMQIVPHNVIRHVNHK